jgi:hypothetical protein
MQRIRARWIHRGFVAVAAAGLTVAIAGPAYSQIPATVGAGAGTGWEYPGAEGDPCFPPIVNGVELPGATFELSHYGTYVSAPATGVPVAAYLGPTDVSITVGPHVAGPLGVYDGACSAVPLGLPVGIDSVQITGSTADGGSVSCNGTGGLYTRVQSAVNFTFNAICSITSNLGLASVSGVTVTHTITGTMTPCVLVPPLGFPTNPECDAIEPPEADPGSHLVTTYVAEPVPLPV